LFYSDVGGKREIINILGVLTEAEEAALRIEASMVR
jgi:hypothetical protein